MWRDVEVYRIIVVIVIIYYHHVIVIIYYHHARGAQQWVGIHTGNVLQYIISFWFNSAIYQSFEVVSTNAHAGGGGRGGCSVLHAQFPVGPAG